jgi:hypothetical protein
MDLRTVLGMIAGSWGWLVLGTASGAIAQTAANPVTMVSTLTRATLTSTTLANSAPTTPAPITSVWKRFTSSEGRFTVLFPGDPKQERVGSATHLIVDRPQEETVYQVSYLDLPETTTTAEAEESIQAIASVFAQENIKITATQTLNLKQYNGQEFRFRHQQEGATGRMRIFLVDRRVYILTVRTVRERFLLKSMEGFLNSFQL